MTKDEATGGERSQWSHGKKLRLHWTGGLWSKCVGLICHAEEFRFCPEQWEAIEAF